MFDLLRQYGIDRVFGNPGSTELPMFADLPDEFSYVLGLQELIVVAMADAYAQVTRRPAFVNLHSAAGLGHAMGSIYTAFRNRAPLIITTGQQSRSLLPHDPFLFAESPTEFPKPYVKWACEPARAEDVPAAIARAYHMAMQAPKGPVVVSVPLGDWDKPLQHSVAAPGRHRRLAADTAALDKLASRLDRGQRAGAGGRSRRRHRQWLARHGGAGRAPAGEGLGQPDVGALQLSRAPPAVCRLPAGAPARCCRNCLEGADFILVLGAPVFTYHFPGSDGHVPAGTQLCVDRRRSGTDRRRRRPAMRSAPIFALPRKALAQRVRARPDAGGAPARRVATVSRPDGITPAYFYQTLAELRSR